jgi:hypothetical protein
MKINDNALSALYGSYLSDRIPPSREDCPSLEELLFSFHSRTGIKNKRKIIDHVTQCAYCVRDFMLVLEVERAKEHFVVELGGILAKRLRASKKRRLPGNIFLSCGFWQYAATALGIMLLSASFFTLLQKTFPFSGRSSLSRFSPQVQIQSLEPNHKTVAKSGLIFKWKPIAVAEYYVLEIYDETFVLVWKSPEIRGPKVTPPPEILEKLVPSRTYLWMLTAHMTSGKDLESSLADFRLLD